MRKPKWKFRIDSYPWIKFAIEHYPMFWKDKHGTPRIECTNRWYIYLGWWCITLEQGTEEEWEWYLWVTVWNEGDVNKAISTFPWYDGTTKEQKKPWLNYNK